MHRFEPALDTADQRVVVDALVVRLMRLQLDLIFTGARGERGMAASTIVMSIGQIGVELKIVPAFGEARPVRQRVTFADQRPHNLGGNECESFSRDSIAKWRERRRRLSAAAR